MDPHIVTINNIPQPSGDIYTKRLNIIATILKKKTQEMSLKNSEEKSLINTVKPWSYQNWHWAGGGLILEGGYMNTNMLTGIKPEAKTYVPISSTVSVNGTEMTPSQKVHDAHHTYISRPTTYNHPLSGSCWYGFHVWHVNPTNVLGVSNEGFAKSFSNRWSDFPIVKHSLSSHLGIVSYLNTHLTNAQ